MTHHRCSVAVLLAGAALSGCALLQKAEPVQPLYLTPDAPRAAEEVASSPPRDVSVRLRRVKSSRHLGERVVVRDEHTMRFLEVRRWTEPPRALVEERLAEALFEQRGLTRVVGGAGMTLEVTVRAFELVDGDPPVARVALTCLLHDERRSLFETTMTVEEPTSRSEAEEEPLVGPDFAAAMGRALDEATGAIADRVEETLAKRLAHEE